MPSSPKRQRRGADSLVWRSAGRRLHFVSVIIGGVLALLCVALYRLCRCFFGDDCVAVAAQHQQTDNSVSSQSAGERVLLFIAIGSAPGNAELRAAARRSWLKWRPEDGSVDYRFFSDARPANAGISGASEVWDALEAEEQTEGDLVLQPLATGYGSKGDNSYGQRALFQVSWTRHNLGDRLRYYLRIDDDSFLCLHRLLYELKTAPEEQFFWGRYWCRDARSRADENFMLFSADVIALLGDSRYVGKLLPFDERVTLGWNFGYWSWIMNLTIFDDQTRLDAQQGYLTEYMHAADATDGSALSQFCDAFLYAHHVRAPVVTAAFERTTTRMMYSIPKKTNPRETCAQTDLSFVPARHSNSLPDVKIGLANS